MKQFTCSKKSTVHAAHDSTTTFDSTTMFNWLLKRRVPRKFASLLSLPIWRNGKGRLQICTSPMPRI